MVQIDSHTSILGQSKLVEATDEQKSLLYTSGPIVVFSRLYMRGSTYTSKCYAKGVSGKRNDAVCVFRTDDDSNYGEIESFVNILPPQAIIRVLHVQGQTILQAGHPCRPALNLYKEIDLLKSFIARIVRTGPLAAVPLENIRYKAVFVCVNGLFYAIKSPNNYEHH